MAGLADRNRMMVMDGEKRSFRFFVRGRLFTVDLLA